MKTTPAQPQNTLAQPQNTLANFTAQIDELLDTQQRTITQEFQLRLACSLRAQLLAQI